MNAIPDITALYSAHFQIGTLVLVRVTAMLTLLPVLGSTSVPFQVRVALGLAFTIAIFPAIPRSTVVLPTGAPSFFVMVLAWSRKMYVEFALSQTMECVFRAIVTGDFAEA